MDIILSVLLQRAVHRADLLATSPPLPWPVLLRLSLLLILSVSLVRYLASAVRSYRRLRHIPGPPWAGLSKLWVVLRVTGGRAHTDFLDVCDKYGPVARIGPNQVLVGHPALLRQVLAVRAGFRRSEWYDGVRLEPGFDNVLSTRDEDTHTRIRAMLVHGYSGKGIEDLEAKIDRHVLAFADLIERKYVSTRTAYRPFDLARKAQYFALDVTTELSFGAPFGDLPSDSDVYGYIATTEQTLRYIILTTELPWLVRLLQSPLVKRFLPSDRDLLGIGRAMGIAKATVAERFGPNKKVVNDMLGSFVQHGLPQKQAEAEALVQIMAGTDTVGTSIRATLLYILSTPRVHARLLSEITSTLGSPSGSAVVSDVAARRMPYLQAVIREGLRVFPPVAQLMSKEVPKGAGDKVLALPGGCSSTEMKEGGGRVDEGRRGRGGVAATAADGSGGPASFFRLPEGTKVGYCAWAVSRHAPTWGPDAEMFRPERWLEAQAEAGAEEGEEEAEKAGGVPSSFGEDGEGGKVGFAMMGSRAVGTEKRDRLRNMEHTLDLFFSAGRWQCLGKNIALMELNKVFVELLRRFDFTVVHPHQPWKSVNAGIFLQSDFWVTARKRGADDEASSPAA